MDKLQKKQAEMKSSGIAYVDPRSLSEYQSTASRLTVEEMRLDDMNNRLNTSFATTEMKLKECGEEAADRPLNSVDLQNQPGVLLKS